MKIRENNSGFTLVEMMVSIAAGAILLVAASAMLVTAIHYTGLVYRQASLQQETIGVERVMKIAAQTVQNASDVSVSGDATSGYYIYLSGKTTTGDEIYYVFYIGEKEVCYDVSSVRGNLATSSAGMTVLSENLSTDTATAPTVSYDSSTNTLSVKLTLADSVTSAEPMDACWIF